jgi:hypothetical protein
MLQVELDYKNRIKYCYQQVGILLKKYDTGNLESFRYSGDHGRASQTTSFTFCDGVRLVLEYASLLKNVEESHR